MATPAERFSLREVALGGIVLVAHGPRRGILRGVVASLASCSYRVDVRQSRGGKSSKCQSSMLDLKFIIFTMYLNKLR